MRRAHIVVAWLALVVAGGAFGIGVAAYQRPEWQPRPQINLTVQPMGVCVDSVKYGPDGEFEQVVLAVTTPEMRDGVLVCKSGEFVPVRPR